MGALPRRLLGNRPCQKAVQTKLNGYTQGMFSRQGRKVCPHTVWKLDRIAKENLLDTV
jgi:hypothetical protein